MSEKKIIIHPNQTQMFVDDENKLDAIDVSILGEIGFYNAHIVAKFIHDKDPKIAMALMNELELQFIMNGDKK